MTQPRHTPAPWQAVYVPGAGTYWIEDDGVPCRRRIAIVDDAAGIEDHAANARLIAAAPDLLHALLWAKQFIQNGVELGYIRMPDPDCPDPAHDVPAIINAAIAKATGEQHA